MSPSSLPPAPPATSRHFWRRLPGVLLVQRATRRWWRRLSPARQDRMAALVPMGAMLILALLMLGAFWSINSSERQRLQDNLSRDAALARQIMNERLEVDLTRLAALTQSLQQEGWSAQSFSVAAIRALASRYEIVQISWIDGRGRLRAIEVNSPFLELMPRGLPGLPDPAGPPRPPQDEAALLRELESYLPGTLYGRLRGTDKAEPTPPAEFIQWALKNPDRYAPPFVNMRGETVLQRIISLDAPGRPVAHGVLVVDFGLDTLLRQASSEMPGQPHLNLHVGSASPAAASGDLIQSLLMPGQQTYVPWSPPGLDQPLHLQVSLQDQRQQLLPRLLLWVVVGLSLLIAGLLLASWRHLRHRARLQQEWQQESNFRRAMENSMLTGMRAMDINGTITYVNPAFCAMTGYSEGELLGCRPPYPHWPPDRVEENSRLLELELQGRSPAGGLEVKVQRRDGTLFDARMYVSPLIDAHGVQSGWMTSMTNITESKRVRDQLAQAHERFTTVLEGLDAAVSVVSLQTQELLFANRSYRLWFGADAHGHTLLTPGHAALQPRPASPSAGSADSLFGHLDSVVPEVSESASPDGDTPGRGDTGQRGGDSGPGDEGDVTFSVAAASAPPAAQWLTEPPGDNPGAPAVMPGETGSAQSPLTLPGDTEEDPLAGISALKLTEAEAHPQEIYVPGMNMWFDVRWRYLRWTDGRLAHMLIATDVSARRRAEEQTQLQLEKSQVTNRLITMGEMASSVAHELNQPLTAISNYCSGMVSRLQSGSIDEEGLVAALRKTAHQAERAGQVIHRIRAFVKRSEPQRQWVAPQDIISEILDLAQIELRKRQVQLRLYVAQHLPRLHVDPILIQQVLLNLVKNAAEAVDGAAMPVNRRDIELSVLPRHSAGRGGEIEFAVTDHGPGLPEEVEHRLFEAFFSTKQEGLGIGLALCRSIIESHQGTMTARNVRSGAGGQSGPVRGCSIRFTLPVLSPQQGENSQDIPASSGKS
ncbi:PAS domain-containing sensor histidine kinase [Amphibiibacter pelophylacis]|uniref:PAS domain S-box protein n=1 Tax=Amphibiibacter pelophylacis TaxID=1799477 RepID=A0ACC6NZQ7_9BURK